MECEEDRPRLERPSYALTELWGPVRSTLGIATFAQIKRIAGLAGVNMASLAHLTQDGKRFSSKEALLSAIDEQYGQMDSARQEQFVRSMVEQVIEIVADGIDQLNDSLRRMGWSFSKGKLLPLTLIDDLDLSILPPESLQDLTKASERLRDGDLSGAVTSAAAVVDAGCAEVYAQKKLGDPGKDSFQEKVSKSLAACGVFERTKDELLAKGWSETDARLLVENLRGSLNQAAFVMQKLRSNMGDVHGTREVYLPLVYDSIKWASIIVSHFMKPSPGKLPKVGSGGH